MAMFGSLPAIAAAAPNFAQQDAPKKKGGMFGSGVGAAEIIQALLSGALAARGNPVGMMGLQAMQQKRHQAMQEQQYQQRREDGFQDYVRKEAWEIANKPQSQNPHYFEDNSGNLMAVGPDGRPRMVHQDPMPFKLVPNGLGGVVPVDLRTLMGGQSAPQPVGKITPIEGGPGLGGPGGFL